MHQSTDEMLKVLELAAREAHRSAAQAHERIISGYKRLSKGTEEIPVTILMVNDRTHRPTFGQVMTERFLTELRRIRASVAYPEVP